MQTVQGLVWAGDRLLLCLCFVYSFYHWNASLIPIDILQCRAARVVGIRISVLMPLFSTNGVKCTHAMIYENSSRVCGAGLGI